MGRLVNRHRRRGRHDLNVKCFLLGPQVSRVISTQLAVDRVEVSRRVGLDHQVKRPEVRALGGAARHEEVRSGPGEVAGPIGIRRIGQVVVAVADASGVEVVEAQRVIACVIVGHVELDNGGLTRADLEDFAQAVAEVGGGLKIHNGHPILRLHVAARAIEVKGSGGVAAQCEYGQECRREPEGVPGGLGTEPEFRNGMGGTGSLPVPLGHRPKGTERSLAMEPASRKSPDAPSRSDRRVAGRDRRVACATQRGSGRDAGVRVERAIPEAHGRKTVRRRSMSLLGLIGAI